METFFTIARPRPSAFRCGSWYRGLFAALVILGLVYDTMAEDPINNFCRRFGHQTTVIDRKLYIDGGLINWNPLTTNPDNYTNTWLLYQDLNLNSPDGMPQLYANLSKNSTIPDVSGGYLWGDDVNKYFYLFGGEYDGQPPAATFVLYAYDIINNFWISHGPPQQTTIQPVSFGAGTAISERGEGYYYGGWLSNKSVSGWTGTPVATTGIIKYEMTSNSWTNNTGPDDVRRAEGVMVFIPASDTGMLVYFGGITDPYTNGTVEGQGLDTIFLYDLASSEWYTQTATGTIPGDRRRFCAGATWSPDYSSYNIYIYGGASMPPDTAGYDDMYVLSIPSFTWIKLYPENGTTGEKPHHSMTCNVISGAQMLIIGGTFPLSDTCDVQAQWGTHNADLTEAFDSSPALWKLFAINETDYTVPPSIFDVIGGGKDGGATKTAPADGWDSTGLPILITRQASITARTPTRSIPASTETGKSGENGSSTRLSTGALVGIAVGATAGAMLVLFGCWVCLRRYRRLQLQGQSGSGGRFGRTRRNQPYNGLSAGYPPRDPYYPGGMTGHGVMMQPGYTDTATPTSGGAGMGMPGGNQTSWSPQHGSIPYSPPAAAYTMPLEGSSGAMPPSISHGHYIPVAQHSPPPAELAASGGSGYTMLTPAPAVVDARASTGSASGTGTGTGTVTGTGTSTGVGLKGAYDVVSSSVAMPRSRGSSVSAMDDGHSRHHWTSEVSEIELPTRPGVGGDGGSSGGSGGQRGRSYQRRLGDEGGSPLARSQELSTDGGEHRQRGYYDS